MEIISRGLGETRSLDEICYRPINNRKQLLFFKESSSLRLLIDCPRSVQFRTATMKLIMSPYARYHLQCVDISWNYIFLLSLTSHSSVNEETVDFLRPLRSRWSKKTRSNIYIILQPQWKTCSLVESSRKGKLIILVRASRDSHRKKLARAKELVV